jgi:hypothetical protein
MIVVDECPDFGGCGIYSVGSRCFAYKQGCGGMYGVMFGFCSGVVAQPLYAYKVLYDGEYEWWVASCGGVRVIAFSFVVLDVTDLGYF